jgi:hypothetical protein
MCELLYPFSYRFYVVTLIVAEGLFYRNTVLQFLKNDNKEGDTPIFKSNSTITKMLAPKVRFKSSFPVCLNGVYQVPY